jgi:hypothetical protein
VAAWKNGFQMSSDFGKTFTRVGQDGVDANPFSPNAVFTAVEGDKVAMFSSQAGAKAGHSLDGGKTWTIWNQVGTHGLDYGAVDWASGAIFAMPHEEYKAYLSTDLGKTWTRLESVDYPAGSNKPHRVGEHNYGQSGVGIFSATELVYSHDSKTGIQRSADGGKTWAKVADYFCVGQVQVCKGVGYWLAKKEEAGKWAGILLATKDQGKTWQPVGKPIENGASSYLTLPRFGKSEKHIVIGAAEGILESTDGGDSWKRVTAYPEAVAGQLNTRTVDGDDGFLYDPGHDVFYVFFWYDPWDGLKTHPQQQCWLYRR